jgi:long-chain acyl-CoA synthetase
MKELNFEAFLSILRRHEGDCFIDSDGVLLSYTGLVRVIELNIETLRKNGLKDNSYSPPAALVDVSLGWRTIPVILTLMSMRIPVIPINSNHSPSRTVELKRLFTDSLTFDESSITSSGEIRRENIRYPKRFYDELWGIALIMFTSGTTGRPKGVMLSYENIWSNVNDIIRYFCLKPKDRMMVIRPLTNASAITGEVLPALFYGCSMYVKEPAKPPITACKLINELRISILCTTPTMAVQLGSLKRANPASSLKLLVLSGECLYETQKQRISSAFSSNIWNAYGLTEASPRVSCLTEQAEESCCVGKPLSSVKVMVVDKKGDPLREGETGELLVRGPNVMKGYFQDEESTKEKMMQGWLRTGDLATIRKGSIYLHGRMDGMLIRGGVNVFPTQIEQGLMTHPQVREALVFGRWDNNRIKVFAWVISDPGLEPAALFRHLLVTNVDSSLWPDAIEIKQSLPKTPSDKLYRGIL